MIFTEQMLRAARDIVDDGGVDETIAQLGADHLIGLALLEVGDGGEVFPCCFSFRRIVADIGAVLRGAASRIILAYLPSAKLSRLYAERRPEFSEAGLGKSEDELRDILKCIRSDGFDVTMEQVTTGVSGIAAPIFDAQNNVLGSLSLTMQRKRMNDADLRHIAERIVFGARIVRRAIS